MNLCTFSGRLTADAQQRQTQSGVSVTSFRIAVDTGFGEYKRTEFIPCTLWRREGLSRHLTKGKPVMVIGEWQTEKWTKDGVEKEITKIIVREVEFQQGDKSQNPPSPASGHSGQGQGRPAPQNSSTGNPGANGGYASQDPGPGYAEQMDDVPFTWALIPLAGAVASLLSVPGVA